MGIAGQGSCSGEAGPGKPRFLHPKFLVLCKQLHPLAGLPQVPPGSQPRVPGAGATYRGGEVRSAGQGGAGLAGPAGLLPRPPAGGSRGGGQCQCTCPTAGWGRASATQLDGGQGAGLLLHSWMGAGRGGSASAKQLDWERRRHKCPRGTAGWVWPVAQCICSAAGWGERCICYTAGWGAWRQCLCYTAGSRGGVPWHLANSWRGEVPVRLLHSWMWGVGKCANASAEQLFGG